MSGDTESRTEAIFADIVELPGEDRPAALCRLCAGDVELQQRVQLLVDAHEKAEGFLSAPTINPGNGGSEFVRQEIGSWVGPYKLVKQLGEGGFGVVFEAEQEHTLRRTVALKVIKIGMDTREVVARFEAERQALSLMDHPNIVRVFDAGAMDSGRPYFVMELVDGIAITEYCDKHQLSTARRIELMVHVCRAVQHAHQKGVIHRDLKPGNVLVATADDKPFPKVIDFGIAKATRARLTDQPLLTAARQIIGTPQYMSPEQVDSDGIDIDTRSDVYSLGVMLYELLTGATPFNLRSVPYDQMLRMIREVDPPRPSTRLNNLGVALNAIATARCIAPSRLGRLVRGELDWIVMMALQKERARRYESVAALADDLQRYLSGHAVFAGPPGGIYVLRKFVRRSKAMISAAAVLLLSLLLGVAGTTFGLFRARHERAQADLRRVEAEAERDNSKAVINFLTVDVLNKASPEQVPDRAVRDTLVHAIIEPAAAGVGERFKDKPLIEASVRDALGEAFAALGRSDLALPQAQRALDLRSDLLGQDAPDTISSVNNYATTLQMLGRLKEATPLFKQARERRTRLLGQDHPDTIRSSENYAGVLWRLGDAADAEPLYRQALERDRRIFGDDHPQTIDSLSDYAFVLELLGRAADAEPMCKAALDRRRRVLGPDHPDTITSLNNYAHVLESLGRVAEAEPLYKNELEQCRRVLGEDHPRTITALNNYAHALELLGRAAEAQPLYERALKESTRVLGKDHPQTITLLHNNASVLDSLGRPAQAEPLYRQALDARRRLLGEDHPDTILSLNNYAGVLEELSRASEAEPLFKEAMERQSRVLGPDHPYTIQSINNYATVLEAIGRAGEAEPLYKEALERNRRVLGPNHPDTIAFLHNYAHVLQSLGHPNQALPLYQQAVSDAEKSPQLGPRHPNTRQFAKNLADCLDLLHHDAEARNLREKFDLNPATKPSGIAPAP